MKEIPIKNSLLRAIVDDDDYETVCHYTWGINEEGYVQMLHPTMRLHQLIIEIPHGLLPDHINRNKLDNRKENLRVATYSQSNANRGKISRTRLYKGVMKVDSHFGSIKYGAEIKCGGKRYWLGRFLTPERAAFAYNEKAKELFGEFAYINDIPG